MKPRDLVNVRYIKDEEGMILVEEAHINLKWKRYFYELFNEKRVGIHNAQNKNTMRDIRMTSYVTLTILPRMR